jgi:hypothetical protein
LAERITITFKALRHQFGVGRSFSGDNSIDHIDV